MVKSICQEPSTVKKSINSIDSNKLYKKIRQMNIPLNKINKDVVIDIINNSKDSTLVSPNEVPSANISQTGHQNYEFEAKQIFEGGYDDKEIITLSDSSLNYNNSIMEEFNMIDFDTLEVLSKFINCGNGIFDNNIIH